MTTEKKLAWVVIGMFIGVPLGIGTYFNGLWHALIAPAVILGVAALLFSFSYYGLLRRR